VHPLAIGSDWNLDEMHDTCRPCRRGKPDDRIAPDLVDIVTQANLSAPLPLISCRAGRRPSCGLGEASPCHRRKISGEGARKMPVGDRRPGRLP
jgi:hypothetical protein